jgi:hypothetical protein
MTGASAPFSYLKEAGLLKIQVGLKQHTNHEFSYTLLSCLSPNLMFNKLVYETCLLDI